MHYLLEAYDYPNMSANTIEKDQYTDGHVRQEMITLRCESFLECDWRNVGSFTSLIIQNRTDQWNDAQSMMK